MDQKRKWFHGFGIGCQSTLSLIVGIISMHKFLRLKIDQKDHSVAIKNLVGPRFRNEGFIPHSELLALACH